MSRNKTTLAELQSALDATSRGVAALVSRGVERDQWSRLVSDPAFADRIAAAFRQESSVPNISTFEVTVSVDYGQTLEQHVQNGRASDYAKRNLNGRNFSRPAGLNGVVTNTFVVLNYGRNVSSDEVIVDATRLGLHRPTSEETLVVGRARPNLVLVGLVENPWLYPHGDRRVPVVLVGEADLVWFGLGWDGNYSFLFRK